MSPIANRRAHLVVALTIVLVGVARFTCNLGGMEALAPHAVWMGIVVAAALAGGIVLVVSRLERNVPAVAVALCAVGGGVVGAVLEQSVFVDRPAARLSVGGVDCDASTAAALGVVVGAAAGGLLAAFSWAARKIARLAPELSCVAGWTLAASVSALATFAFRVELALLATCAGGVAIQLASLRELRRAAAPAPLGPYR